MKNKIFTLVIILSMVSVKTFSQDTLWHRGGLVGINFNQASFTNWAAGGENSISGNARILVYAKYKKDKLAWDNIGDFAIGGNMTGTDQIKKTDDKIDVSSKVGYDMGHNFYLSYLLNFKSQFTEGFTYYGDTARTRISNWLTPGYLMNSLGVDWKPKDYISVFLSPLTVRTTFVEDQTLVDASAAIPQSLFGVDPGKNIRNEFGAYFVGQIKKEFATNIVLATKLELFSNYANDPQNLDVNWEVLISMKVNKLINVLIGTQLLYDNDVFVPKTDVNAPAGPGTQFKETIGIGLSYNFGY